MATAIYVRVSSSGQKEAAQLPDLERWARAQDDEIVWYRDRSTGTSMERDGWARLWADVLLGRFSRIVVWRIDRLGRLASGLTKLFEDLTQMGVDLVSLRDGLDLGTPAGRLMANVLASVAVYETEVRSERQLAGIAAAKERGVKFGRPAGSGKPITISDEKRELVRQLYREGKGVAKIARLATLSRTTVYKILNQHPGRATNGRAR